MFVSRNVLEGEIVAVFGLQNYNLWPSLVFVPSAQKHHFIM